ncbi:hypothetical protein [Streptomyces sp. WAC06273]|uniref:hypothetical protein n=1 Tax=Streptomyces sp. WAC06273 TaxID=2487422 RepID=UPI000F74AEC8|nr:hypothetical protein [Streptomyces sp. WAC06273]RSS64459.1 hypothetical protein EF907_24705 [Streptomyces sp. WAC06273]
MANDRDYLTWTPKAATAAACRFYEQHTRDMQHAAAASLILGEYERILKGLGIAFAKIAPDGPEHLFPEFFRRRDQFRETVNLITPAVAELGSTRCVENFLCYVSDIITDTLIARPELLKSQEQVTLEDVLQHDSIEGFISWAAENRVAQLSFKGLEEISSYIKKRLSLDLHQDEADWKKLKKGVALRNLIVHRRSVIDQRFIHLTGEKELTRGTVYKTTMRDYVRTAESAMKIVGQFDEKVAEKFSIPRRGTKGEHWYCEGRWGPEGRKGRERTRAIDASRFEKICIKVGRSPTLVSM